MLGLFEGLKVSFYMLYDLFVDRQTQRQEELFLVAT